MSLYDKFHSDININYMYDLLGQIIVKNTGQDIKNNVEFKNMFIENSKKIFDSINTDDISEVNKVLLENHIEQFTEMINTSNPIKLRNIDEKQTFDDRYNDLMHNRNLPLNLQLEQNNDKMTPLHNNNPLFDNGDTTFLLQDVKEQNIQEIIEEKKEETPIIELIKGEEEEKVKYPEYKIYSSKRNNIQSSRFNYVYNLKKNNIESSKIKNISKIIIPFEDSYIFSMPVLFLRIKEFDIDLTFELTKVLENDNKKFGYYHSIEKHEINVDDIDKITIDIRDVSETRYDHIDIAKVNIIELKNNEIQFTCTNIEKNNYFVGDFIKIINNYTKTFKSIVYPLKIKRIEKNIIICDFNSKLTKKYSDVDMKLLNTSNQNIIYFN